MLRYAFLFVFLFVPVILAQTNVSGYIASNTIWDVAGSPYIVTGNITVNNGVTLTVNSNVTVKFSSNTRMVVLGTLNAQTATFTSNAGSPAAGDWNYIQIGSGGVSGSASLTACDVQYGGVSYSSGNGMLYCYRGILNIDDCDISFSKNYGILVWAAGAVNITDSRIFSCDWPIAYNGSGDVNYTGTNNLAGNTHDGILINYYTTTSNMVLEKVDIPYVHNQNHTINAGVTVEIASTNILKFTTGGRLNVSGTLIASANSGETIYFTAYTNDNIGGDTNADGTGTAPSSAYWYYVKFNDSSDDGSCVLNRCDFSFGGRGNNGVVITENASPLIENCDFSNNYYGLMLKEVSDPVVSNNTIGSSDMVPIAMSIEADPVFNANVFSFSDNNYDAIGLLVGTLQDDANLVRRNVVSVDNVTYLLLGNITVPSGKTLNIVKGIVIKSFNSSHRFIIKGKMTAVGGTEPDSMITFTSAKDDNHGNPNDTNKDGTQTVPVVGDWAGIVFESGSDPTSTLQYCRVKYGKLPSARYNDRYISGGAITLQNTSAVISDCEISNTYYGIYAFLSSNPTITDNDFSNSQRTPLTISVSADPTFSGNTFTNTGWTALGIIGGNIGLNGIIKKRNIAGYTNITNVLVEDLTINSGINLEVEKGVVLKMLSNVGIFVDGGFRALGNTGSDIIRFTSIKDDNFGNPIDTQNDGNQSVPARGDWETIKFRATSDDGYNKLDYCVVDYGSSSSNGVVIFSDAGGVVTNTVFSNGYGFGIRCEGTSDPSFDNVTLQNCRLDPVAMSLKSNPTFTNMVFAGQGNGSNGIRILEGTLGSDATLSKRGIGGISNIAYIVNQLTVASGAVFTIDPGVVIKFVNTYSYISVNGALIAEGTKNQKIVFTSIKDDSKGGDTNDDGTATSPVWGDWWSIVFNSSATENLNSMKNCLAHYGGRDISGWNNNRKDYGTIRVIDSKVVVDSCAVEFSHTSGFGVYNSSDPEIKNNEIFNIRLTPVTMSMFASPVFSGNVVGNLGKTAIGLAIENYSSDRTIPIRNFAGINNITYFLYSTLTINTGTTITIPAGVVMKSNNTTFFTVNGGLMVNGNSGNPVVFTHEYDDEYGNPKDTNNDGQTNKPAIQTSYNSLNFTNVSDDASSINYAIMRYRAAGVNLQSASPSIQNCMFNQNTWGVILRGISEPQVVNNNFDDITRAPIIISLVTYASTVSGNIVSGSTYRAIGVLSEELVQDVTLPKRNFAGITNIPYYFSDDYTIGTSVILTLEPGLVLKFPQSADIKVKRGLIAEGGSTPDSIIVFTDIRDDFYGGDTNADSNLTAPIYNSGWSGIIFQDEAFDAACRLKNCIIRFAGRSSSDGAITANSASPTILYSVIKDNRYGLTANGASNPAITYSDIYDNFSHGVRNVSQSFVLNAENNWWGTNNGPTHSGNPGGTGQSVTDGVDYDPWLTSGAHNPLMGDVSLNGIVQAFDASQVLKEVVSPFLNTRQLLVADVSGAGGVTAFDASLILQHTVGSLPVFPAEEMNEKGEYKRQEIQDYMNLAKKAEAMITIASAEARAGESVTVSVNLTQVDNINSLQFALQVNPDIVSIRDVALVDERTGIQLAYKYQKETGQLRVALASGAKIENDGSLLNISFDISDQVKGEHRITMDVTEFLANEINLTESVQSGVISIAGKPLSFNLFQNYPNPFNPTTTIKYQIPENSIRVKIEVYNIVGQLVRNLLDVQQDAGEYEVIWDGTNDQNLKVASGVYFYRMQAGEYVSLKKFHLLK